MMAAQVEVSVSQALIRLRADAFGNDRRLAEVADDVVSRRLPFDAASGEKDPACERPAAGRASGFDEKEKRANFAIYKDIDIEGQLEKALDAVMGKSHRQEAGK